MSASTGGRDRIDDDDDPSLDHLDVAIEPPPADAEVQAPYRRMIGRLRELPPLEPPAGWEARAEARLRAARARERRRWMIGAGVAVLAAAAVVFLLLRGSAPRAVGGLELAFAAPDGVARRGAAALGDRLHAQVPASQPFVELRVYLGDGLLARCPSTDANVSCRRVGSRLELELDLRAPGTYRVVALAAAQPVPPPGDDGLDGDLLRARSAGVTIVRSAPVPIR